MPTSLDPNARLEEVLKCVKDAATETIGIAPYRTHRRYTQDPLVAKLSSQQRALRHCIEATGDSKDRSKLRRERCHILRQINRRLPDLACCRVDTLASEITSSDDFRKMFRAVKAMKFTPRQPSLSVQDPEGKFIATDKAKADAICMWFAQWFTDPTVVPLASFVGPVQPLNQPVTATEVEAAIKLLQNGHALGPECVHNY